MLFYLSIYAIACFFSALSDICLKWQYGKSASKRLGWLEGHPRFLANFFLLISLSILGAVRGLRYGIGVDYFNTYIAKFNAVVAGQEIPGDFLYNLFIKICAIYTNDYKVFFMIDSIIFMGCFFASILISKTSRLFSVAMLCAGFHFARSMNGQAQYLAASIALLGIAVLVFKNKRKTGLFILLLAGGFHSSALVMLVPVSIFLAFNCLKNTKKSAKFTVLFSLAMPICIFLFKGILRDFVRAVLSGTRFGYYFGSSFDVGDASGYLIAVNGILFITMAIIIYRYYNRMTEPSELMFLFQSFSFSISLLTGILPLAFRIAYYYMLVPVILMWSFIKLIPSLMKSRIFAAGIIIFLLIVQVGYLMPQDRDSIIPYVSIFTT